MKTPVRHWVAVLFVVYGALETTLARGVDPQSAATYLSSAENRYRNGDIDGALADYDQAIRLDPRNPQPYQLRGYLRMQKKDLDGAIADFTQGITLTPKDAGNYALRGSARYQKEDNDGAIADSLQALALDGRYLMPHQTLAHAFWNKVSPGAGLADAQKRELVARGTDAVDAALSLQSDDLDMSEYRLLFLRLEATLEKDPSKRQFLTEKGDAWARVLESLRLLNRTPPPPPAPRPTPPASVLRVGPGTVPMPKKLVHVEPIYPRIAIAARVAGTVVLDVWIDDRGRVITVSVTKSIPLLDQAAAEAVSQWVFEPVISDGKAVPAVLSIGVTFKLTEPQRAGD